MTFLVIRTVKMMLSVKILAHAIAMLAGGDDATYIALDAAT